ncbi:protein-L-isoaspartate(D-aspartate) O-methyltransferase [Acidobacteriota bacterium]
MKDFDKSRFRMVENQIQARGVKDPRVLDAMRSIPRHLFVQESMKAHSYNDEPLVIGEGQTISQPYIVAYMTEALKLKKTDRVLEIGTGSGYQSAVLAEIVAELFTVELIPSLSQRARKILSDLGYSNIHFKVGDGTFGWSEFSPYDAVMVTAAPSNVPENLKIQMKDGARMVIPVGDFHQELIRYVKEAKGFSEENLLPVRFVPLVTTQ